MKSIISSCLLFGLLLVSGITHADGECPEGMFPTNPTGTQGPVGCAPIPSYNQQRQQQAPQPPPPRWESRWMAIATDSAKGSLGTANDMASREQAEQAAMTNCQLKGGLNCKLENSYSNGCAAMVVGDKGYNVNGAATLDAATQLAMKTCSADGDPKCHVYYSACSLPRQIQ